MSDSKVRCAWVNMKNPLYVDYHDNEWGVPVHDDRSLFELLRSREQSGDTLPDVPTTRRESEPDLKVRLAAAIDALPDGYRMVFVMHDVEGYTHDEIGAALGIQQGTSKAQLFRARARLRNELADFEGEWAS